MNHYDDAFKPIKENHIILDFTDCNYLEEIHLILKEKFGLPAYYGENWDALWDCLDDRFCEEKTYDINICGYATLNKELRDCCVAMLEIFEDIQQEHPNVIFKLLS